MQLEKKNRSLSNKLLNKRRQVIAYHNNKKIKKTTININAK